MAPERLGELSAELQESEMISLCRGVAAPVALTGATGFVGRHVLAALRGAAVPRRVLARGAGRITGAGEGEEVVPGALEDETALRRLVHGAGTVVHVAGLVRAGRAADFEQVNAGGTACLLAAMAATAPSARLVYVSSLAAAGPSATPAGRHPKDPPAPISAYGRSKLRGEELVRGWPGDWVIVRPPAVYGPGDRDVLQFFKLAARGVVPLPAGERWVTVTFVTDVVRAVLAACQRGGGKVFHLGEPQPYRLDELIFALARAGELPRPRVFPVPPLLLRAAGLGGNALWRLGARGVALTSDKARELLARHWTSSTTDSLLELGLTGFVPFAQGARVTWAWYRQQGWVARATIPAA